MTDNKGKSIGPLAAGVVGGAVGVAVGAAAIALTDEKNRKKAIKAMENLRTQTSKTVHDLTKQMPHLNQGDGKVKAGRSSRRKIAPKKPEEKSE